MCQKTCKACQSPTCNSSYPPPNAFGRVSYWIFDLESSIFDTRNVYQRACREVVAMYDREVPDLVFMQSGPMEIAEMAELVCRKCDLPVPWEEFLLLVNDRAFELVSSPPLMPGIEKLLLHLDKCCLGLALITSNRQKLYQQKIQGRETLFELFNHVVCGDDPELFQQKPEPDIYQLAMSRFCGTPSGDRCLAFEGTVKGVQAAREAKMMVVMLPEKSLPCYWSKQATQRLDTLEEFQPEMFGIPVYNCDKKTDKKDGQRKSGGKEIVTTSVGGGGKRKKRRNRRFHSKPKN